MLPCDVLFGILDKFTLENDGGSLDGHRKIGECTIEGYLEERGKGLLALAQSRPTTAYLPVQHLRFHRTAEDYIEKK